MPTRYVQRIRCPGVRPGARVPRPLRRIITARVARTLDAIGSLQRQFEKFAGRSFANAATIRDAIAGRRIRRFKGRRFKGRRQQRRVHGVGDLRVVGHWRVGEESVDGGRPRNRRRVGEGQLAGGRLAGRRVGVDGRRGRHRRGHQRGRTTAGRNAGVAVRVLG